MLRKGDFKALLCDEGSSKFSLIHCDIAQNLIRAESLLHKIGAGTTCGESKEESLRDLLDQSEKQLLSLEGSSMKSILTDKKNISTSSSCTLLKLALQRDLAMLRCQLAGKQRHHQVVVDSADEALRWNSMISAPSLATEKRSSSSNNLICEAITCKSFLAFQQASALGYKGYGLLQQKKYDAAVPILEQSLSLFHSNTTATVQTATPNNKTGGKRGLAKMVQKSLNHCRNQLEVTTIVDKLPPLIKFPRTTHLIDMGASTHDDLVNADVAAIERIVSGGGVMVEEKIDGANLGISLSTTTGRILVQNRSHYISSGEHSQFSRLPEWVAEHDAALRQALQHGSGQWILYGEWMVARHSIPYHKLPGYFVAFDLYDTTSQRFVSRHRFHRILRDAQLPITPTMSNVVFGPYKKEKQHLERCFRVDVVRLLERQSVFRSDGGTVEGIVLRIDDEEWLKERFKIVRSDFIAGCGEGHWSKRTIEKQRVDFAFAQEYLQTCYPLADVEEVSILNREEDERKQPALTKEQLAARKRARRRVPRCVMLMGLPGAGKSTFSKALTGSEDEWIYVNQDELGRKQAFKEAGKASRTKRVIIDRCHPTEAERQQWFDAMHSPSKGEVALVYFSASAEECTTRVVNRLGHPNVPATGGAYIVQQVAARLEPPTAQERTHVFGTVEMVASFAESQILLRKWGIDSTTS